MRGAEEHSRHAAVFLLCLGAAWAAAVIVAPWAVQPDRSSAARFAGAIVYEVGARVCHQRSERSFATAGVPWPVCGRCTGLYLSFAVAAAVIAVVRTWRLGAARLPLSTWRMLLLIGLAPTAVSWVLEQLQLAPGSPGSRAWLAAPAGAAIAALLQALGRAAGGPEVD
jgi:uncharacterized membrane protein